MDRRIIYPGAIPYAQDLLGAEKWAVEGLADLAGIVLGTASPAVSGMAVVPNSPAALNVIVQAGSIYAPLALDASAYSSLTADSHVVMQQGLLRDPLVLTITPPGTTGQSRVYLVQAACQVVDTDPSVLPYFNAANPAVALTGPGNSGTPQNTRRAVVATVNLKAGTPAATGSQVAPSVDAGFVALATVTVANGATSITSGNIVAGAAVRRPGATLPDFAQGAGWQRLPGNRLMQWGTGVTSGGATTVVFPTAFGAAPYFVIPQENSASSWTTTNVGVYGLYSSTATQAVIIGLQYNGTAFAFGIGLFSYIAMGPAP